MKLSIDWLADFVSWKEKDPLKIAERITISTAEVEEIEKQGELLDHCCVGKVLSIKKHPNADTLVLVDVETDKGKKRVVCGGTNLIEGMRVAFAHSGATVKWHGEEMATLSKVNIRGEESVGMICAAEELELSTLFPECTGKHIVDLSEVEGCDVGKDLRKALGLTDTILHIDNHAITHRGDLFSQKGFARECVALGLAEWKKEKKKKNISFTTDPALSHVLDIPKLVPRYLACSIDIDECGETPLWMKRRLESIGIRSLILPIDITNYVMAEVGMPLHSFDRDDIVGDIHFREAKEGESIVTLDAEKRTLPKGSIVLSDNKGIFDLMGIMGGERSSTKESSRKLYLHSAIVDPIAIHTTLMKIGLRTEASTIYEKNIPPITAHDGFLRALELFQECVPGATITSERSSWGDDGKPKEIALSLDKVSTLLGKEIAEKEVVTIFANLGFETKKKNASLSVKVPLWRLSDIHADEDLIEEIARIHGYEKFFDTLPTAPIDIPARDKRKKNVRLSLKESGYSEILPLSLVGESLLSRSMHDDASHIEIENPLTEDLSFMQASLLPRMLEHAENSLLSVAQTLQTFSISHVFPHGKEHEELAVLCVSKEETSLLDDPFLMVKQDLTCALKSLGYALRIEIDPTPPPLAHPGRTANLFIKKNLIGTLYEIHPTIRSRFDLPHRAAAAQINLSNLYALSPSEQCAKDIPQFPAVTYDLTVTHSHTSPLAPLLKNIEDLSPLLESVEVHNLFTGPSLNHDQYSLTIRCTYRSDERTLTEEEVQKEHEKVEKVATGA